MEDRFELFTSLLTGIRRSIRRLCAGLMAEYGLNGTHAVCIYHLYKNPGLSLGALSLMWGENKANVSRAIVTLEEGGFAFRRAEGTRRNSSRIYLTAKGEEVGRSIIDRIREVLSVSAEGISPECLEIMYESLNTVNENLSEISEKD